jgi:hypothetical protein
VLGGGFACGTRRAGPTPDPEMAFEKKELHGLRLLGVHQGDSWRGCPHPNRMPRRSPRRADRPGGEHWLRRGRASLQAISSSVMFLHIVSDFPHDSRVTW